MFFVNYIVGFICDCFNTYSLRIRNLLLIMITFSDAPITSYWVSHIACFGFLVLINSSNSILVRGVYIDAEEDGTQCVDFPCYYVRLLVQVRSLFIILHSKNNKNKNNIYDVIKV